MLGDVEILPDLAAARWPRHPQPMQFEHLDTFVRRLAEAYGVGLGTFCRYGLGVTRQEWERICNAPPSPVLERLSAGSGLSMRRLHNMTPRRSHVRLLLAMRRLCREHPDEVSAWLARTSQQTPV